MHASCGCMSAFPDLGSGCGMLSIAAALMGSAYNIGFELDPDAIRVCRRNLRKSYPRSRGDQKCFGPLVMDIVETDVEALLRTDGFLGTLPGAADDACSDGEKNDEEDDEEEEEEERQGKLPRGRRDDRSKKSSRRGRRGGRSGRVRFAGRGGRGGKRRTKEEDEMKTLERKRRLAELRAQKKQKYAKVRLQGSSSDSEEGSEGEEEEDKEDESAKEDESDDASEGDDASENDGNENDTAEDDDDDGMQDILDLLNEFGFDPGNASDGNDDQDDDHRNDDQSNDRNNDRNNDQNDDRNNDRNDDLDERGNVSPNDDPRKPSHPGRILDTVICNPPFGTRRPGIDLLFVRTGLQLARTAVYSLHKTSTRRHILRQAQNWGVEVKVLAELRWTLPRTMKHHREDFREIEVDFIRFAHPTTTSSIAE